MADREAHIPSVAEEVVGVVDVTTLSSRQYCVVLDPVGPEGKPQLGKKKVVKVRKTNGPSSLARMLYSVVGDVFRSRAMTCCFSPSGRALIFPAARRAARTGHPGRVRAVGGGGASAASRRGLPRRRGGETPDVQLSSCDSFHQQRSIKFHFNKRGAPVLDRSSASYADEAPGLQVRLRVNLTPASTGDQSELDSQPLFLACASMISMCSAVEFRDALVLL